MWLALGLIVSQGLLLWALIDLRRHVRLSNACKVIIRELRAENAALRGIPYSPDDELWI